jgi:hypothetical protein
MSGHRVSSNRRLRGGRSVRDVFARDASTGIGNAVSDVAVANWRTRRALERANRTLDRLIAANEEAEAARHTGTPPPRTPVPASRTPRGGGSTSLFAYWLLHTVLQIL